MSATVVIAKDGLVARPSGAWAKDKLYYAGRYFGIFNAGMKNHWERRVLIDLLAGPGLCILEEDHDDEFDGSPLIAFKLDTSFTSILCVEGTPSHAEALEQRLAGAGNIGRAQVRCADCNSAAVIDEARERLKEALGVVFVDTLGATDPAFSTIAAIVDGRRADLVVTLQVNDFTRNANAAMAGIGSHAARFDRFFGTTAWRERIAAHEAGNYLAVDLADALTDLYLEQLATLGLVHQQALHRLMKNSRNAPLYRMVFASRDDRGLDFWNKVTKLPPSRQGELF